MFSSDVHGASFRRTNALGGPMIAILVAFSVGALVMPLVSRRLGRTVFLVAAIVPLAAFIAALIDGPRIVAGETITQSVDWIPELALSISVRMDALSWLLTLVVTGVGALVLVYCAR
ncbi:MAG: hypothetical protein H7226_05710, partial [Salinibacterium sp.]|nr:hypothetical protein [Salinibacterium sp.]